MKVVINSIDKLPALAAKVIEEFPFRVIAFYGDMGVGKTTFIKSLCSHLGVDLAKVCSPTYSIVNEYETPTDILIYHFDFYRISHEKEALIWDMRNISIQIIIVLLSGLKNS